VSGIKYEMDAIDDNVVNQSWLVGWSLTSLFTFQHKCCYIRDERSEWRVILLPSEGRLAIY